MGRIGKFLITNKKPPAASLQKSLAAEAESNVCAISRTASWFDWGYAFKSKNGCRWVAAYNNNGEVCAYGVWGMREESWSGDRDMRAHLVKLAGTSKTAKQAVLATIIKEAFESRALLIETLCSYPSTERVLCRASFIRHRRAPLIARKITQENLPANIHNHETWRIMGGDVDTF